MTRRLIAAVLLLGLIAGACAGASDGESVAATQSDDTGSTTTTSSSSSTTADSDSDSDEADDSSSDADSSEPAADETSMAESSPIGAFFSEDGGFEAALAEYTVRVEEAIVVCMAAQGFEFARSGNNTRNPAQERQNELSLRDWTIEFGYGISTSFDSVTQNLASNPNFEIFVGLSPAEQEVWAFTLNGVGVEALLGGPVDNTLPLEDQGCIGQSLIETGGQEAIEGLGDFGDVYEEAEEALFERREMVDVVDAWVRCMSQAGHPNYATLDDPEDEIRERFEEVTAPLSAAEELTDEEGQALLDGDTFEIENMPNLDIDALRQVQADEKALALVDLDCYETEVQETYEPLRDDLENGLLTEYSAEFDALRSIGS